MIAHLTSRKPLHLATPKPISDVVPWAWAYTPGAKPPASQSAGIKPGKYILAGKVSGRADVEFKGGAGMFGMSGVSVTYTDFSDDGLHIINGTESADRISRGGTGMMAMMGKIVVKCDLKMSGIQTGTKVTGEGGFSPGLFGRKSSGTMSTTIDGKVYKFTPAGILGKLDWRKRTELIRLQPIIAIYYKRPGIGITVKKMEGKSLQSRKRQLVQDAIYEAAIDLFTKKGFDETTVEELAEAAGISRRSFFRYFQSKDDLLGPEYGELRKCSSRGC